MRIAVIGCGPSGQACAALTARDGHAVTIFERADSLGPVGAGLLIQPTGQAALAELGVADAFETVSAPITKLLGTNHRGRTVLDLRYADLGPGVVGRGVHRAALACVLERAVDAAGAERRMGTEIAAAAEASDAVMLTDAGGASFGPFDLVVVASGARSPLRDAVAASLVRRDRSYPWGALWFVGQDPEGALSGVLRQVYQDTRRMIGFLPSGRLAPGGPELVSMFWSIARRDWTGPESFDLAAWRTEAIALAPFARAYLEQVTRPDQLIFAAYSDVVMRRPFVGRVVFIGDAAHAMSPQLGQGANLGMMDASVLARALRDRPTVAAALASYTAARRRHIRFYQFASRWLTPAFQSDHARAAPLRDAFVPLACRVPFTRRLGLDALAGVKTGVLTRRGGGTANSK